MDSSDILKTLAPDIFPDDCDFSEVLQDCHTQEPHSFYYEDHNVVWDTPPVDDSQDSCGFDLVTGGPVPPPAWNSLASGPIMQEIGPNLKVRQLTIGEEVNQPWPKSNKKGKTMVIGRRRRLPESRSGTTPSPLPTISLSEVGLDSPIPTRPPQVVPASPVEHLPPSRCPPNNKRPRPVSPSPSGASSATQDDDDDYDEEQRSPKRARSTVSGSLEISDDLEANQQQINSTVARLTKNLPLMRAHSPTPNKLDNCCLRLAASPTPFDPKDGDSTVDGSRSRTSATDDEPVDPADDIL